jgi:hypothetical protein
MMKRLPLLNLITFVCFICNAQNIGIGTTNPGAKLHISSGLSGYSGGYFPGVITENNTNTYLNFLTPNIAESGILFGNVSNASSGGIIYNNVGNSNALQFRTNGNITRMIIDNSGRVGMGVTPTISDGILDIHGRLRIQSGGDIFHTAGIWLNNVNNSSLAAFIGMNDDDSHVGFYGGGSGWRFEMNTQNGALRINGSEGNSGQVLQSNGIGTAPSWASSTNALYNNTISLEDPSEQVLNSGSASTATNLNGMSYTFTLAGNAKVLISFDIPVDVLSCIGCGATAADVNLNLNGALQNIYFLSVANGSQSTVAGTKLLTLTSGTYTVSLAGWVVGNATVYGNYSIIPMRMTVQIIPQ